MPRSKHPENVSPYTGLRVPVCKGTYTQEGGGLMLQGHTTAIVPFGNPTPKKLPTGGGEWPTFRTARAQRTVRPQCLLPWPAGGGGGCAATEGGPKSAVAQKWVGWLHNPCCLGGPQRFRAVDKIRSGPQVGRLATSPLPSGGPQRFRAEDKIIVDCGVMANNSMRLLRGFSSFLEAC